MRTLKRHQKSIEPLTEVMEETRKPSDGRRINKLEMAVQSPSSFSQIDDDECVELTPLPSEIKEEECLMEKDPEDPVVQVIDLSTPIPSHQNQVITISDPVPVYVRPSGGLWSRIASSFRGPNRTRNMLVASVCVVACVLVVAAYAAVSANINQKPPNEIKKSKDFWQMCWNMRWSDESGIDNVKEGCNYCQKMPQSSLYQCLSGDESSPVRLNLTMSKPKRTWIEELRLEASDGTFISRRKVKAPWSFSTIDARPGNSISHSRSNGRHKAEPHSTPFVWFGFLVPPQMG